MVLLVDGATTRVAVLVPVLVPVLVAAKEAAGVRDTLLEPVLDALGTTTIELRVALTLAELLGCWTLGALLVELVGVTLAATLGAPEALAATLILTLTEGDAVRVPLLEATKDTLMEPLGELEMALALTLPLEETDEDVEGTKDTLTDPLGELETALTLALMLEVMELEPDTLTLAVPLAPTLREEVAVADTEGVPLPLPEGTNDTLTDPLGELETALALAL